MIKSSKHFDLKYTTDTGVFQKSQVGIHYTTNCTFKYRVPNV